MALARNKPVPGRSAKRESGALPALGLSLRVVVVDDHRGLRDAITEMLRHDGWAVRPFSSVEDALVAVRTTLPDVVLTDINVGVWSGAALARELRLDPATAQLSLVAMSGTTTPTAGMLRLFDLFLVKPIDLPALDGTLREVVLRRIT